MSSIYDEPNPDAQQQQAPFVLQRGPATTQPVARLVWNVLVALLVFIAFCSAVVGGAIVGGLGGALIAAAVGLAYLAHLIESA